MAVTAYARYALTTANPHTGRPAGANLYFYCDTEAELPSGANTIDIDEAYTVDTNKKWRRTGGVWVLKTTDLLSTAIQDASGDVFTIADLTDGQFLKRVGTTIGSAAVAGGGDMLGANNLSDVASAATSRSNLGLGTAATTAATDYATAAQGAKADTALQNVSTAWPIGSVFISVVSTNPATLLGFGTWSAFGAGRVLVGLDSGDTDFDTVEEVGGEKTHTLTIAEIPAHVHNQQRHGTTTGGLTGLTTAPDASSSAPTALGPATASTGGGGAHNNIQPYIVVYMWKRTA